MARGTPGTIFETIDRFGDFVALVWSLRILSKSFTDLVGPNSPYSQCVIILRGNAIVSITLPHSRRAGQ